ncbi:LysR substrate-binding domain-containing protein [Streptomyces sp. NPDC058001]|uniref:LysR substrate-binding domain-containing protein n=1 Tax=Streptomyces sp. NPDC058001 TaxID=3346300 RepID=UPI0036E3C6DE
MDLRQMLRHRVGGPRRGRPGPPAATRPGWAVRAAVDRAFRAAGVDRDAVFEVNDIVATSERVRHDLGVCVLPEPIAARFPDLSPRRFVQHVPRWNVMVVHRGGDLSPAAGALLPWIT